MLYRVEVCCLALVSLQVVLMKNYLRSAEQESWRRGSWGLLRAPWHDMITPF